MFTQSPSLKSKFIKKIKVKLKKIDFHYLDSLMIIDHTSIEDLEILLNLSEKSTKNTLISMFKCETNGGGYF